MPIDARARDAALAAGAGELGAWLAAVSGSGPPHTVRVVSTADVEVLRGRLAARGDPVLGVAEVALAVDTGRELAARAAADGVHVLVATVPGADSEAAARALAAGLAGPGDHGPLGALRRLGDAPIAVACGVALGAGERGLGCVAVGPAALTGATVAAGIEPGLRPRLAAAGVPAGDALVRRLGAGLVPGTDAGAVAAALAEPPAATPPRPGPPSASPPAPR